MGYDVSIPTNLIYDNRLSDSELRLYLIIRDNCNRDGYSEIKNNKLEQLSNKKERFIRGSLASLEKQGHIVVKQNVKQNDIYPKNIRRVIWMKEAWLRYKDNKKKNEHFHSHAKPSNDYKKFIDTLRNDYKNIPFTIKHTNGELKSYIIKDSLLHYADNKQMMRKEDSELVYKILFANRHQVLENPTSLIIEKFTDEQEEVSNLMNKLAGLARR